MAEKVLFETFYHGMHLEVIEKEGERSLQSDRSIIHSRIRLNDPEPMIQPYQQQMMLALAFLSHPKKVLHLGLGGGCQVSFIDKYFPEIEQDVVECCPEIVTIAHAYFRLPKKEAIRIHICDAADLSVLASGKYDLIFLDLCDSNGPIPHFQTISYLRKLRALLQPEGWVSSNSWATERGLERDVMEWKKVFSFVLAASGLCREAVIYGGSRRPVVNKEIEKKLPFPIKRLMAGLFPHF